MSNNGKITLEGTEAIKHINLEKLPTDNIIKKELNAILVQEDIDICRGTNMNIGERKISLEPGITTTLGALLLARYNDEINHQENLLIEDEHAQSIGSQHEFGNNYSITKTTTKAHVSKKVTPKDINDTAGL